MPIALRRNRWLFALLAGSTIGLLVLGVGGRVAMYGVAVATHRPPIWTIEGTTTVLLFGLWIGAAAGLLRCAAACWLPSRLPEWSRTASFAVICVMLGLRGISPFSGLTLALFLPVVVTYVVGVELAWRRMVVARAAPAEGRGADAEAAAWRSRAPGHRSASG